MFVPYFKDEVEEKKKKLTFSSISMKTFKRIHGFWFDLKQGRM